MGKRVALNDLCLEIGPGEVFGCLGTNGAGETTTLRLLAGMLRPTSGRAQVPGHDAWRDSVSVHRRMGYLSGEPARELEFHQILRDHTDGRGRVLLSAHVLSEVQRVADRVGVLRLGRLQTGC